MAEKIKMVCARCGGENIRKDAYASWDVEAQDWVLHSTYDSNTCEDCGDNDARLEEVPI